uniref:Rab3GAP catalytic subunit conserved domain-containing protein n=1 Tax=Oryza punctata TaxID=4537 RepID=A0A0E0LL64_ORYPU
MHHLPPPAPASAASSSSTTTSLVSRARTAIHSAAARVLTDIKADLRDADGSGALRAPSPRASADRLPDPAAAVVGSPQDEVPDIIPSPDGDSSNIEPDSTSSAKMAFPSVSVVKQLVAAIDNGKNFKSMNDMRSNGDQLLKEKGGLSLSVVKSLVRREKDERSSSEFVGDDETQSLMYSLFKLEEHFPHDKSQCNSELHHSVSLPKDLHGAPPESFTHRIAETIGKISSVYKMAYFWQSLVLELKKLWSDGQPVPRMPLDATPDLNCCLLHQEIQVINCCIARKKRRKAAKESLDSLLKRASIDNSNHLYSNGESPDSEMYVKGSAGDNVLRLGADHPSENLTLLETGEPVYSPTLQEGPIMTAELIKETEELVLRTGSVGAGCSQLLSDMQAFKARCVLEDFIRWHSPPDWSEDCAASSVEVGEGSSRRGRLSERMQTKEGNLWKELWGAAKSIPAVEQAPIYDEDLAVESIFDALEVIEPSKLFEQLLAVILSVCFVAAELVLPAGSNLSKLFYDCKDYIISIYQDDMSKEKLDEICKVYETMEAIVTHPEETLQIMEAPDERSLESKYRFKIKLNFIGKDRQPLWKRAPKDPKEEKKSSPKDEKRSSEERSTKIFSNLLDKKVSIFSKKNAKPTTEVPPPPPPSSAPGPFDDSEWTIL